MYFKKLLFIAFYSTVLHSFAVAQNIVNNGSFEIYSNCPDYFNQVSYATGWIKSMENNNGAHHTDYAHSCGSGGFTVPDCFWGYQGAADGVAYMCQATTATNLYTDYRENIYSELLVPMVVGQQYKVSFKVCKSDIVKQASNKMGIKFSMDAAFGIDNICDVFSDAVVTDTGQWKTISGLFTADSAYQFIGVGNFFTDAQTTITNVCGSCPQVASEYMVDDIRVIPFGWSTAGTDTSICAGDSTTLFVSGDSTQNIQWKDLSAPDQVIGSGSSLQVSPATTTSYLAFNSYDSVEITVHVFTVPDVFLGNDTSFCGSGSVILNAPPVGTGGSYLWQDGSTGSSFTVVSSGEYHLSVNANGCLSADTIAVTILESAPVELGPALALCVGDSQLIDATTPYADSYAWSSGETTPFITAGSAGTYVVTAFFNGCPEAVDSVTVDVFEKPDVTLGNDTVLCGEELLLDAGFAAQYLWNNGATSRTLLITEVPQTLYVQVSIGSCVESDSILIGNGCYVYVPNAFSPNGDGVNDLLNVRYLRLEDYEMRIYNRWGMLLCICKDPDAGWDGTYKMQPQPLGTYVYYVTGLSGGQTRVMLKGNVTLMR